MSNGFDDIPFFDEEPAPRPQRGGARSRHRQRPPAGIAARAMAARDGAPAPPTISSGLNPEQREAVETLDGPVLVLAGAGTGKTRVLTTRIAHILATGRAFPSQILAVTFTNKAAREMKERIGVLVGGAVEGMPWLGTFHSIGVKLLRRHAELVGLKSDFTILDTDDVVRLIKQLIQAEGIDDKRWPAKQFAQMIDGWKNKGLGPAEIPEGDARAFANGKGRELYAAYQARLKTLNACDFGDLLLHPIRMFRAHPDVLARLSRQVPLHPRRRVSGHQHRPVYVAAAARAAAEGRAAERLLRRRRRPVDLRLARRRGRQHPALREGFPRRQGDQARAQLPLDRAYPRRRRPSDRPQRRPPRQDAVHRPHRSRRRQGAGPRRLGFRRGSPRRRRGDRAAPAHSKHTLNDMAILVRASFQMREFEDRFVTLGLNYRVIGGPRFYERLEIRDALAYFRLVCQPADDLAFERIVNTPKRGLGDTTVRALHDYARAPRYPDAARPPPTSSRPTR